MSRRLLVCLLSSVLCFLISACARRETPAAEGIRTHTLLVGNGAEPGSLDPHLASILSDQIIVNALFEGLTLLDERTTQPLPAAAETWSASADGLVWTFHLRAGLQWSNGESLTADDFIQTWRRALNPRVAADNAWYLFAIKNAEAYNSGKVAEATALGLAAPDARTVVITLERPTPYLPALVSLPAWFPLNPRLLAKFGALDSRGGDWTRPGNLVSNGAFMLSEWTPNARLVVAKNPHHREAATNKLERVIFFPIENPDVEERNFRAGQLHVTFNLPVTKIAGWREKDPAALRLDPALQANFLRFNTTRPPFTDPRVRRALALAVDRDSLAHTVLQGSRQPAPAITPPGTGGYTARAAVGHDVAAARQLLAAAGFPGGAGLPAIELQCRNDEIMPRLAEALQAMWQHDLGVRITLAQVEQKTWIQNQQTLNYGISTAAWTADFPDPVTFLGLFTTDSSYNWTGWKNPAYDQLLNDAASLSDMPKRYELFQQAEALLLNDAPVTPLHYGALTYLINPAVRGWDPAPLVFRRFQKVSLEP
ncbi:MAG: peptide ABC transporter substrate-binding protein [Lacunisphaera sp.]|nr:peptide ABC transporter substrate-binding protein [Lacunisphaera sp.]